MSVGGGGGSRVNGGGLHEFGLVWYGFLPNLRPLGCFLLVYFGVVLVLLVLLVVLLVVVTGVKQSQLLVPA